MLIPEKTPPPAGFKVQEGEKTRRRKTERKREGHRKEGRDLGI